VIFTLNLTKDKKKGSNSINNRSKFHVFCWLEKEKRGWRSKSEANLGAALAAVGAANEFHVAAAVLVASAIPALERLRRGKHKITWKYQIHLIWFIIREERRRSDLVLSSYHAEASRSPLSLSLGFFSGRRPVLVCYL
jgi:hypothetical protein